MFAIPGIVLLVVTVYVRPQEIWPELGRAVPLLYLGAAMAFAGLLVDLRLRLSRAEPTPQFFWVLAFYIWCLLTLGVRARTELVGGMIQVGTSVTLYLVIAHGAQTFRALQLTVGVLLGITLFLSFVGVHQGLSPYGCHVMIDEGGIYDGRPCANARECEQGDAEPGADYMCEQAGLFGTSSIGDGRVRYIGPLQDPNELALAIGVGLPFAFAFVERRRSMPRMALFAITFGLVAVCTVFTRSRGGQLVFLAVVGVYFVRRFRLKGLILGALLSVPILLFGGRSGEEADSSSVERLGCWFEGMTMVRDFPLFGVGQGQFVDHHTQTAHNSYILAPAELGLPGMVLWSIILYLSTKIPIQALRRYAGRPEAALAHTWAGAFTASSAGLLVGILFLSFCYHPVLWIYIGLTGALSAAIKTHDPEWRVTFGRRDLALVLAIDAALVLGLYGYTRIKGAP